MFRSWFKKDDGAFRVESKYGVFFQKQKEKLLDSALRQDIILPHNCRVGQCLQCEATVNGRTVLTCQYSAEGDCFLDYDSIWQDAYIRNKIYLDDVMVITLHVPEAGFCAENVGQYIGLKTTRNGEYTRKYSVVDVSKNDVTLHIKHHPHGIVSTELHGLDEGAKIYVSKPRGNFIVSSPAFSPEYAVVIANGTGMGVSLALLKKLQEEFELSATVFAVSRKSILSNYHKYYIDKLRTTIKQVQHYNVNMEELKENSLITSINNCVYIVCGHPDICSTVSSLIEKNPAKNKLVIKEVF